MIRTLFISLLGVAVILDFVAAVNNVNIDFLAAVVHQAYVGQNNVSVSMLIGNAIRMFVNHANVVS